MMRALLLMCLSTSALAEPRTDLAYESVPSEPSLATLYLRTDGALDSQTRVAIDGAVRLLARLPGATLAILLEPRDQSSAILADTLSALPETSARVALLARLADTSASRWAQRDVVTRIAGVLPRNRTAPVAFLQRPSRLISPTQSYFEIAGTIDPDEASLDALIAGEHVAAPTQESRWAHRRASGLAGHRIDLPWRSARDACGPVEVLRHLNVSGRISLHIAAEVDPGAAPGTQAVARALRRATPSAQIKLAALACSFPAETIEEASWLLGAAGIDAEATGLLESTFPIASLQHAKDARPVTIVDGTPTSYLDALSLQRLPSLRHRLARR